MDGTGLRYAIGLLILAYAIYAITCHLISIFKYKAQIVMKPPLKIKKALSTLWTTGDDIWWAPMAIVILLFGLGLVLMDFFGLLESLK